MYFYKYGIDIYISSIQSEKKHMKITSNIIHLYCIFAPLRNQQHRLTNSHINISKVLNVPNREMYMYKNRAPTLV